MDTKVVMVVFTLSVAACSDKAKPDYDECVRHASNDNFKTAALWCQKAVSADPASSAGKAAANKLKEIQPKLDAVLVEEEATKEQALRAEAERKAAKADAEAKAAQEVTSKVRFTPSGPPPGSELDDLPTYCTNRRKPPHLVLCVPFDTDRVNDSSVSADEQRALCPRLADMKGCAHTYDNTPKASYYCCP